MSPVLAGNSGVDHPILHWVGGELRDRGKTLLLSLVGIVDEGQPQRDKAYKAVGHAENDGIHPVNTGTTQLARPGTCRWMVRLVVAAGWIYAIHSFRSCEHSMDIGISEESNPCLVSEVARRLARADLGLYIPVVYVAGGRLNARASKECLCR